MSVVLWQVLIGSVWGITNALMKQGAAAAHARRREQEKGPLQPSGGGWLRKRLPLLHDWLTLLLVWEYSLPFVINISVSSIFFLKLKDAPLSLAVPVTNAITFLVTAVTGAGLGEPVDTFYTGLGIALTTAGAFLWTPQGTREDTAEEAAARPVKFMPLFVVMERRKEALRRAAEAAARLKKQEQGGADGLEAQEEERVLGSDQNVPEGEWIGKDGESGQQAASFMQVDSKKFSEEHQKSTQEGDVEMLSEDSEGSEN